ncbi:probable histone-lysine N-methyltransferase set-23 [Fopius arisanus]|uniref:Probable histone-lysine N-methyltransferase set-23 n=1 Tax=Fopius arisanus TaxID=64838 RepID=A0A9R1TCS3_9HYME|nr:PREDICTED: probable histone-lysine N-methyltransferase set-23 [Fopius arisanus]
MEIARGESDNYDHPIPSVMYITTNIPGVGINARDFESEFSVGCSCTEICEESCSCMRGIVNYINDRLNPDKKSGLILECNPACSCLQSCSNRLVQSGPLTCLEPFQTPAKGIALRTNEFILENQFICEYAGEVIGIDEARKRMEDNRIKKKMNYILVVTEHVGDRKITTCIDPSIFGNIGRYCNHSCQPNANLVPVRVEGLVPRLCLFASRNIQMREEITFDYGGGLEKDEKNFSETVCLCGSSGCSGFLPHHPV